MKNRKLLISGASVWTGDLSRPSAGAVLIENGIIAAVGSPEEVSSLPGASGAFRVDAQGASVVPGLTDSHLHLTALARQQAALSLHKARSREHLLELVRQRAAETRPGEWIYGVGFNNAAWPDGRLPTMEELDGLGIPNPVLLLRICAHVHVVNSRALEAAGLSTDMPGQGVMRDGRGNMTGTLLEDAAKPVAEAMKKTMYRSGAEEGSLRETMAGLAAEGITTVHTCSAASYGLEENIEAYRKLAARGALPLRVRLYADEVIPGWNVSGDGDEWLAYGGVKFFLDGSLGGRTAAMSFPYVDEPSTRGILNMDEEDFRKKLADAHKRGLQSQVHAIGDAAIDQFIQAAQSLEGLPPLPGGLRHRLVHAQICRPDQMDRLALLGIVCDVQPVFVPSDIHITEPRIGTGRLGWAYAWKSMLEKGILLTASSDTPVEPTNPWRGIWAALARVDDEGNPPGGWLPEQKLDLRQALTLYTVNPWRAIGEGRSGLIRQGNRADLVLLDRNLFETPVEKLPEVRPVMTFVGGRLSWGDLPDWEAVPS
ncbi:MAG: amidohydrolase [Thermovirgaceae bacterium]